MGLNRFILTKNSILLNENSKTTEVPKHSDLWYFKQFKISMIGDQREAQSIHFNKQKFNHSDPSYELFRFNQFIFNCLT